MNSVKHESDNSDSYSHPPPDDNKQSNLAVEVDYNNKVAPSVKLEPVDAYEAHQLAKQKM